MRLGDKFLLLLAVAIAFSIAKLSVLWFLGAMCLAWFLNGFEEGWEEHKLQQERKRIYKKLEHSDN